MPPSEGARGEDFSAWVVSERMRQCSNAWRRLVDKQLLAWLCAVRRVSRLHHRAPACPATVAAAGAAGPGVCASSGSSSPGAEGAAAEGRRGRSRHGAAAARDASPVHSALPRPARDLVCAFVGDQTGAGVNAQSLRRRADAVRLQDVWSGLLPELGKAADQGMMTYHLNQRIEQLAFWRPWMLEPDGPQWIRSCLEERGLRVDVCKVYHTAYAGVQGCSFFELKVWWSGY